MSLKKAETGKEILYHCPKCNLQLAHTVLAVVNAQPARIRCNTCKSERNYRRSSPKTKKEVSKEPSRKHHSRELYDQKIQESLMKSPKTYSPQMEVEIGDLVQHPKFGKGVVLRLIPPDRMEAIFPEDTKTLVCQAQVKDDFFDF